MEQKNRIPLLSLTASMLIFGTIGIFVKFIPLPSDIIAMSRGIIGGVFLFAALAIGGKKISLPLLSKKGALVILSGAFIGFNWIFLFEAYRYTSVANATLGYYMAPVLVILLSPVFLKENLTAKKLFCVLIGVFGMVFVSGVLSGGAPTAREIKGIILSLCAACFYASIIITNKKITDIPPDSRTPFQLLCAAIVLIPYSLDSKSFNDLALDFKTGLLLIIVGIVHTGIAYALYFRSMNHLKGDTVAIFSYIDPVSAIILSAIILPDEPLTTGGIIGAVLILGAAFLSQIDFRVKFSKKY